MTTMFRHAALAVALTALAALSPEAALAGSAGGDGSGTAIPGPAALGLFAAGVAGLILARRLRGRK